MRRKFQSVLYRREGRTTLEVRGELDGSTAAELCNRLQALRLDDCCLNLLRVEEMDAFSASVLARGLKLVQAQGTHLTLAGPVGDSEPTRWLRYLAETLA
jgi:anti-anti-sigma factor